MEHHHIPSAGNGEPLNRKSIFLRGEDSFLRGVWYGRCAVCGELICPPKLWYWLRYGLIYLLAIPVILGVVWLFYHATPDNAVCYYLITVFGCLGMPVIAKLLSNICLALGRWQSFPKGTKGEKLYQRDDRKGEKVFWLGRIFAWLFAAANFALLFFGRVWLAR